MIMSKTISVSQIKEAAQEAYEQFKDNTGGKNADYIPYLANIDKNLFGISICLLDGRTITLGCSEDIGYDRCRCHRSSFQLHHGDLVGK